MFPSPIGELHFSITRTVLSVYLWPFPSPIGELHFSMMGKYGCKWFCFRVSVPYRGATFLNAQRASIQRWLHSVSVPYRGATFLNHQLTTRQYCIIGFRPLSGSYISQLMNWFRLQEIYSVSVPYRGATFLNMSTVILKITCVHVSVPYRGATFLNLS